MSSKEIVKKFNKITQELLYDMSPIVGQKYHYKFKLIIKCNSILPIKKFKVNVLKFKKYIIEKNPAYFLDENLIIEEIKDLNDREYYLNEYNYLKNIYLNIDDNSKDNFWDILHALTYLCETYHYNN
jgi:hypothetical protein